MKRRAESWFDNPSSSLGMLAEGQNMGRKASSRRVPLQRKVAEEVYQLH